MDEDLKNLLNKCKTDIITRYAGNNGYKLKHTDYLTLSEEIYDKTKISLSLSTLRRFFSKEYNRLPKISTLNAFAMYLDYDNWKEYCKENSNARANHSFSGHGKKKILVGFILVPAAILLLIVAYFIIHKFQDNTGNDLSKAAFWYDEYDSTAIPVTVTFHYNIKGLNFDSAIFHPLGIMVKGMDDIKLLDPDDSVVTYSYLYPGCFYPKLVFDGEIVKQQRINFITDKWLASVAQYRPFYIKYMDDEEIFHNGKLHFSQGIFERTGFPVFDVEQTWYQLFKDFDNIDGDSMCFETRIRNKLLKRSPESERIFIELSFANEGMNMTFDNEKSSLKELGMWIIDQWHSSKREDLSFLYLDFENWETIKCKTHHKQFELYTNDSLVYTTSFTKTPGKLIGIRFIFNGLGEIDYVKFFDSNNALVYSDEFD